MPELKTQNQVLLFTDETVGLLRASLDAYPLFAESTHLKAFEGRGSGWEWGSVSNKMLQWRKNTWQDGTRIQDFSYSVQIIIEPISQTILSTSDGINATDSCIFSCSVCQFFYISVKFLLVWMFYSEVTVFTFIRCLTSMYRVTGITFGFIKQCRINVVNVFLIFCMYYDISNYDFFFHGNVWYYQEKIQNGNGVSAIFAEKCQ